jgi:hypothetical protein
MKILLMAAEQGPNVLFYMPNRTKCFLLVSVMTSALLHCTGVRGIPIKNVIQTDAAINRERLAYTVFFPHSDWRQAVHRIRVPCSDVVRVAKQ